MSFFQCQGESTISQWKREQEAQMVQGFQSSGSLAGSPDKEQRARVNAALPSPYVRCQQNSGQ